jgi:lipid II isoglutaminyl synthase (glutamine-hydrolysing)
MLLASYIVKFTNFVIRSFNKGSGYTLPGHVVLKLLPFVFGRCASLYPKGVVFISGTNGKTTTAKILTHLFESFNLKVVSNKSGANLLSGLISSMMMDTDLLGRPRSDIGVFEVDEFTLPKALKKVSPKVLVLLNLSRDQLDRYGEVDIIFNRWEEALGKTDPRVVVVADSEQGEFHRIPDIFNGKVFYFDSGHDFMRRTGLHGDFNAKNVNASVLTLELLGYERDTILENLEGFSAAYGRGELVDFKGKSYQIFLAKNPASFNHNLELISSGDLRTGTLLYVLNDGIPDGRDVSWIYDIEAEKLKEASEGKEVFVGGTRYLDMAVRLEYAGVSVKKENISSNLEGLLEKISTLDVEGEVTTLPNYSAMLELREILLGRKIL